MSSNLTPLMHIYMYVIWTLFKVKKNFLVVCHLQKPSKAMLAVNESWIIPLPDRVVNIVIRDMFTKHVADSVFFLKP